MFWAVCQSLKGRCWVITSVCWHHPTTSKQAFLLEALLYLQAQDRKVCQHPSTLLTNVANVRRWGSILLGQQRYLHNWLHLQPMEPCTNGPQEEEISICKFQAEYSCFPQTLVELSLPSVGWHRKIISFSFPGVFMSCRILSRCFCLYLLVCLFAFFSCVSKILFMCRARWMIMCTYEFQRVHTLWDYIWFSNCFVRGICIRKKRNDIFNSFLRSCVKVTSRSVNWKMWLNKGVRVQTG